MRITICLALTLVLITCLSLKTRAADDAPAAATRPTTAEWDAISNELGIGGVEKDGVYTVTALREDVEVHTDDTLRLFDGVQLLVGEIAGRRAEGVHAAMGANQWMLR